MKDLKKTKGVFGHLWVFFTFLSPCSSVSNLVCAKVEYIVLMLLQVMRGGEMEIQRAKQ